MLSIKTFYRATRRIPGYRPRDFQSTCIFGFNAITKCIPDVNSEKTKEVNGIVVVATTTADAAPTNTPVAAFTATTTTANNSTKIEKCGWHQSFVFLYQLYCHLTAFTALFISVT